MILLVDTEKPAPASLREFKTTPSKFLLYNFSLAFSIALHLNDQTLAGLRMKSKNCFSVQYHPEAGPGPNDASYLFDIFKENIIKSKII